MYKYKRTYIHTYIHTLIVKLHFRSRKMRHTKQASRTTRMSTRRLVAQGNLLLKDGYSFANKVYHSNLGRRLDTCGPTLQRYVSDDDLVGLSTVVMCAIVAKQHVTTVVSGIGTGNGSVPPHIFECRGNKGTNTLPGPFPTSSTKPFAIASSKNILTVGESGWVKWEEKVCLSVNPTRSFRGVTP